MAATKTKICLELRDIGIVFNRHRVLKDISLVIEEQEIVSIIGPNGAGKSTLFNIIGGQVRPTSGAVYYCGRDITNWPAHKICRAGIARTFQSARPFFEMSVLENVLIGLWFGKPLKEAGSEERGRALELLELVGLVHKADIEASELTLSEQRRLEIARALATSPHLLLLDEIAAGLSPQATKHAVELIRALRDRGLTLILIDHYLNLTAIVSDRLVALNRGEIIVEGRPSEVLVCEEVVSAYLGEHVKRKKKDRSADET